RARRGVPARGPGRLPDRARSSADRADRPARDRGAAHGARRRSPRPDPAPRRRGRRGRLRRAPRRGRGAPGRALAALAAGGALAALAALRARALLRQPLLRELLDLARRAVERLVDGRRQLRALGVVPIELLLRLLHRIGVVDRSGVIEHLALAELQVVIE